MDALTMLVQKYEDQFPAIIYKSSAASRATAAADIVEDGHVQKLQRNLYRVKQYTVSGKSCDCADQGAPTTKYGKLCKHRIAVMMTQSLAKNQSPLHDFLSRCTGDTVALKVSVMFRDSGESEKRLASASSATGEVKPHGPISFTDAELVAACRNLGWTLTDAPIRGAGYAPHTYRLWPVTEQQPQQTELFVSGVSAADKAHYKSARIDRWKQKKDWRREVVTNGAHVPVSI